MSFRQFWRESRDADGFRQALRALVATPREVDFRPATMWGTWPPEHQPEPETADEVAQWYAIRSRVTQGLPAEVTDAPTKRRAAALLRNRSI